MSPVGEKYAEVLARLSARLGQLTDEEWDTPVPTCPGWSVHSVLAHLVGIIEDAAAGRITGPPDEEQTAEQVARAAGTPGPELLAAWTAFGPTFAEQIPDGAWPAFLDALSHEVDIATALHEPADVPERADHIAFAAELLGRPIGGDPTIGFRVEGTVVGDPGEGALILSAPALEVFRLRLGRRSASQVGDMDWNRPPGEALTRVFAFGPAENDIRESSVRP